MSMGRMSWEAEEQDDSQRESDGYDEWWQYALDSNWATDDMIAKQCGAMYAMWNRQVWVEHFAE